MASFEEYLEKIGEVGYVDQVVHSILRVKGLPGLRASEVVVFENDGMGQVLSLADGLAEVLPLSKQILKVGSRVARTTHLLETVVGEKLLGKTLDPLGNILDGDGVVGRDSLERRE